MALKLHLITLEEIRFLDFRKGIDFLKKESIFNGLYAESASAVQPRNGGPMNNKGRITTR